LMIMEHRMRLRAGGERIFLIDSVCSCMH
jgi:hypothetical protein